MTSDFLSNIGLGAVDIGIILLIMLVLLIASLTLLIIFIIKEEKLRKRYNKFMQGKEAASLEEEIVNLYEDNRQLKEEVLANRKDIKRLYKKHRKALQKVGIVKYDAYQQMGGMLSYSICMLDEYNNGFIINSVHSTEGCYSYTKAIKDGECDIELGNEEKIALDQALSK